jgi:hypothetical protein
LMTEAICPSEPPVLTRATRHNIPEDGILLQRGCWWEYFGFRGMKQWGIAVKYIMIPNYLESEVREDGWVGAVARMRAKWRELNIWWHDLKEETPPRPRHGQAANNKHA